LDYILRIVDVISVVPVHHGISISWTYVNTQCIAVGGVYVTILSRILLRCISPF